MGDDNQSNVLQRVESLSEREREVLNLIAGQYSNQEIANTLFIALTTVKWHIRQIYNKLGADNRQEAVALASQVELIDKTRVRHNLPTPTTPLIGRKSELLTLAGFMTNRATRLVTILAPGGMGKTHLVIEVTRQHMTYFADGIYYVPLSPLTNHKDIVPQIAACMGFQLATSDRTLSKALIDALRDRHILLILDNFEHLMDGVDIVNALLAGAPRLWMFVTSRQRLNLIGETVYHLNSLSFPVLPDDGLDYDAVELFIQTAKRVNPEWEPEQDNIPAVLDICRLTQGMPLGVILAASWVGVYPVTYIRDAIQQNLDFLSTDIADMLPRQRSIKLIFEATWALLKPEEQTLFMKLSIFRGGCNLHAMETIAHAEPRILQGLIDKALVTFDKQGRYEIHELLRQYAERLLEEAGFRDEMSRNHAYYYSDFVAIRDLKHGIYSQPTIADSIEADFDNIRTAWNYLFDHKDYQQITPMILPLFDFFWLRQHRIVTLYRLLEDPIATFDTTQLNEENRVLYGRLLLFYAQIIYVFYRQRDRGRVKFQQAYDILVSGGDALGVAYVQHYLAFDQVLQDNKPQSAYKILDEVIKTSIELGCHSLAGISRFNQARALQMAEYPLGECALVARKAFESLRPIGDYWRIANVILYLSNNHIAQGDYGRAIAYIQEGQNITETYGLFKVFHYVLGCLKLFRGELRNARNEFGYVVKDGQRDANRFWAADGMIKLAHIASLLGQHRRAQEWLDQCERLVPEISNKWYFRWQIAKLAFRQHEFRKALEIFEEAAVGHQNTIHSTTHAWHHITLDLAFAQLKCGKFDEATAHLIDGLRYALKTEHRLYYAQALCGMAELYMTYGWSACALELARYAYEHPVTPYEFRCYAGDLLITLGIDHLPPYEKSLSDPLEFPALDQEVMDILNQFEANLVG